MSWFYLFIAIVMELFGTSMMKLSYGMSKLLPTVAMFAGYILCFCFLSLALKTIEMGVAYAIWSAVGLILIALIGIIFFHEAVTLPKILGLSLIVAGVVTVKLNT